MSKNAPHRWQFSSCSHAWSEIYSHVFWVCSSLVPLAPQRTHIPVCTQVLVDSGSQSGRWCLPIRHNILPVQVIWRPGYIPDKTLTSSVSAFDYMPTSM